MTRTTLETHFPWRPSPTAAWLEDLRAVEVGLQSDSDPDVRDGVLKIRRLAGSQLDARQQLKMEGVAKRLVRAGRDWPTLRRFRLGLIASRTWSYLPPPLSAAGLVRGLLVEAEEAPYDSVAAYGWGSISPFANALDAVVVILDEESFPIEGAMLDRDAEDHRVSAAVEKMQAVAAAARSKNNCPTIMATLPQTLSRLGSADALTIGSSAKFNARLNAEIIEGASRGDWIVWDLAALANRIGLSNWHDPVRFHSAKTSYRIDLSPVVADSLCALVAAMAGKAARALVLDLDNTLWGGVIGDDGLAGITLGQNSAVGEAYVAMQRFVLALRERGVVLAVCSKNDDEIAREPFRKHPDMVLKEHHIAVFQANWSDKASNINTIAEMLNLGLESIVFVDDNPAERERVRQELPLVHVPEIGDDPSHFIDRICGSGLFEHMPLTQDDLGRAGAYGGLAARAEVINRLGGYDEYLRSLKMVMTISPFDSVGRTRIAQLINKSNQFNLTTRRYNVEEVRGLEENPATFTWQARLDDAFAAQGMICVVVVRTEGAAWTIDTWLQSCRVLERGVEETMMNVVVAAARSYGAASLHGLYIPTDRNGMVGDFYDRMGFAMTATRPDGSKLYTAHLDDWTPFATFIEVQAAPTGEA